MAFPDQPKVYEEDPRDDIPLDAETEAEIDAALERARHASEPPMVAEAVYHPGPVHGYLMVRLTSGQRLLIPKEMLQELGNATDEQIADIRIPLPPTMIYWPQLDEGLYIPEFLAHRWRDTHSKWECEWVETKAA